MKKQFSAKHWEDRLSFKTTISLKCIRSEVEPEFFSIEIWQPEEKKKQKLKICQNLQSISFLKEYIGGDKVGTRDYECTKTKGRKKDERKISWIVRWYDANWNCIWDDIV